MREIFLLVPSSTIVLVGGVSNSAGGMATKALATSGVPGVVGSGMTGGGGGSGSCDSCGGMTQLPSTGGERTLLVAKTWLKVAV